MENSKILQIREITVSELSNIIRTSVKEELQHLHTVNKDEKSEELLTRKEVLKLLDISSVTLWNYQNSGKINVYKFSNKCFYKKNELIASLISLKK
jgi:hypothetical protein